MIIGTFCGLVDASVYWYEQHLTELLKIRWSNHHLPSWSTCPTSNTLSMQSMRWRLWHGQQDQCSTKGCALSWEPISINGGVYCKQLRIIILKTKHSLKWICVHKQCIPGLRVWLVQWSLQLQLSWMGLYGNPFPKASWLVGSPSGPKVSFSWSGNVYLDTWFNFIYS